MASTGLVGAQVGVATAVEHPAAPVKASPADEVATKVLPMPGSPEQEHPALGPRALDQGAASLKDGPGAAFGRRPETFRPCLSSRVATGSQPRSAVRPGELGTSIRRRDIPELGQDGLRATGRPGTRRRSPRAARRGSGPARGQDLAAVRSPRQAGRLDHRYAERVRPFGQLRFPVADTDADVERLAVAPRLCTWSARCMAPHIAGPRSGCGTPP